MPDLLDPREYTLHEQIVEVDREIAMREFVYPNRVRRFKMTQAEADRKLALMKAVRQTLEHVQNNERARS